MGWHRRTLTGFDQETTRTDRREVRIVAAEVIELADRRSTGHPEQLGACRTAPRSAAPVALGVSRPVAECRMPVHTGSVAA